MTLRNKRRHGQVGFTLIELLIVVAIIGIIAAILIPNFLDALQKAKQKATVADIRNTGTAWLAWMTDQVSAGAAGQTVNELDWEGEFTGDCDAAALAEVLEGGKAGEAVTQFYIQRMPTVDGWENALQFGVVDGLDCSDSSTYVKLITAVRALGIRSLGRDGEEDGGTYTAGDFPVTQYDGDIVWADGYFVRSPGGAGTADEEEEQSSPGRGSRRRR
jgi:prepilin-type N-terminal cleavage/methylation domain-containing protein